MPKVSFAKNQTFGGSHVQIEFVFSEKMAFEFSKKRSPNFVTWAVMG